MNKIEIIYHEGQWLVIGANGKVIFSAYAEAPRNYLPVGMQNFILEFFGVKD